MVRLVEVVVRMIRGKPGVSMSLPELFIVDGSSFVNIEDLEDPLQFVPCCGHLGIFDAHQLIEIQSPTAVLVKHSEETLSKDIILKIKEQVEVEVPSMTRSVATIETI